MSVQDKTGHLQCCDEDDEKKFRELLFDVQCYTPAKESLLTYFNDNEYWYCSSEIFFSPFLIDSSAQDGIFPYACKDQSGNCVPLFKLGRQRWIVILNPSLLGEKLRVRYPTSNLQYRKIVVKKKLLGKLDSKLTSPTLSVFINRAEDLYDVFRLIYKKHGEMWMCCKLRQCFVYMFQNPHLFQTKVIITAVRRVVYDHRKDVSEHKDNEGELVACEVGFLVGDIYTSCTGAYSVSGCGLLQLRVTGEIMKSTRCSVWDLGMYLEYKKKFLGIEAIEKECWVKLVKYRRRKASSEDILSEIQDKYHDGVNVQALICLENNEA